MLITTPEVQDYLHRLGLDNKAHRNLVGKAGEANVPLTKQTVVGLASSQLIRVASNPKAPQNVRAYIVSDDNTGIELHYNVATKKVETDGEVSLGKLKAKVPQLCYYLLFVPAGQPGIYEIVTNV